MKVLVNNLIHELAEQLKVNSKVLKATLQLVENQDRSLAEWIEATSELNEDKVTRAYNTIVEIE
ncbi:MAG: hypothetical protein FWC50_07060 [Planctomycetaceae bacterium]|nr:hypothetical protein [Planctomycetaceae bacterium]